MRRFPLDGLARIRPAALRPGALGMRHRASRRLRLRAEQAGEALQVGAPLTKYLSWRTWRSHLSALAAAARTCDGASP
jgi:hypothetical protein